MNNNLIDLHTHSTASDASFTPEELICHAKNTGLRAIALTDHDTTDGIAEASKAADKYKIEFVPGIELSAKYDGELHIIGLFIDPENPELAKALSELKESRINRNKEIVKRLNRAGINISYDEVLKLSNGGMVGRTHIGQVLVNKGYTLSVKEAFKKYLGQGKIGFSDYERLDAKECIRLIKDAGGMAFLAHCHYLKMDNDELTDFIRSYLPCGLDGIECYYSEYTYQNQTDYLKIAKKLNLKVSGGSDFHGIYKPHIALGTGMGNLRIPYEVLEKIKS